jgi:rhamnogalacturonan endolyase
LFGDWREEIIFRTSDNQNLRIYTTTIPTNHRIFTLMHDPQYRLSVAAQNVAYNQPPHTSFFIGTGMVKVPEPDIVMVKGK